MMFKPNSICNNKFLSKTILTLLLLNTLITYFSIGDLSTQSISNSISSTNDLLPEDAVITNCSILSTYSAIINANPREMKLARIGNQDILFLASGYDGLLLLDISNMNKPRVIAKFSIDFFSLDEYDYIYSTCFKDSYCFIAYRQGILIYDFSDIHNPEKVAEIEKRYMHYRSIKIKNSVLFLLDYHEGCYVYNISNIESPIFVNLITFGFKRYYDIIFYENNDIDKIIISGNDYLVEYNYSSILEPKAKIVYYEKGLAEKKLTIIDNYLLSTSNNQLSIFDISQEFLLINRHIDEQNGFICSAIKGDYLFLAGNNRLVKADIGNLEKISLIYELNSRSLFIDIILIGEYLLVLDDFTGIKIYSINDQDEMKFLNRILFALDSREVIVSGNYAFYSTYLSGIFILNIRNPARPKFVSYIECPYDYYSMYIEEEKLYVFIQYHSYGYSYKILIYDISKPMNPQLIGINNNLFFYNNKEYTIDFDAIEIVGDKLYTEYYTYNDTNFERGLALIDLSNPSNLTIQNILLQDSRIALITVKDGYLYLVSEYYSLLNIYHLDHSGCIGNSTSLIDFGYSISYTVVEGNYLYVSLREKGLVIYDIQNILSPIELSVFKYGFTETYHYYNKICVSNNYLYLQNYFKNYIYALDIRDKSNPILEGIIGEIESIRDLFVADDHMFITSSDIPLIIAHLDSIPIAFNLSSLISISIGALSLVAIGLVVFIFSRKRRLNDQLGGEFIEAKNEEKYPSSIREQSEPIIETKKVEIPETDNPDLKKYFEQIFGEDE